MILAHDPQPPGWGILRVARRRIVEAGMNDRQPVVGFGDARSGLVAVGD